MTTYDEIYETMMANCRMDNISMPQTPELMHGAIKNAVNHYNNRVRDEITCDDEKEMVSEVLSTDKILVIAHYIRLTLLKNNRTFKNSIFTTFTQEIGVRNINAQLISLKDEIEAEEETINRLIFNMSDDSIM